MTRPVVWSIAGTDSGGGAGLSADQRAADAFGVHLCPVVACVTAQHSRAVQHIEPLRPALIEAQLQALAKDLAPSVIKTGLLGGAEQVRLVARWVDRLRAQRPLALVVDPVLSASSGARFADAATLAAYRDELLPRATVVTPNRGEAQRLLGSGDAPLPALPALARALRAHGAQAVCITGGDSPDLDGRVLDWIDTEQACGWLASPRVATRHQHGSGCTHAGSLAAALALGFVPADAAVLAQMATTHALAHGYAAGQGAGPVQAQRGFALDPQRLPLLSWGEAPCFVAARTTPTPELGLYAIVDSAERVHQVLNAGVRAVQLRIKSAEAPGLRAAAGASLAACRAAGAEFFLNDHVALACELGAGLHLGQQDLLALGQAGRDALGGVALGISTHSLWELCRARALAPRYLACGPVWPTLTKAMPWVAQGLDNLAWWCRVAQHPVVAIGGILQAEHVQAAARCGADGVCVVRALGNSPASTVPALRQALQTGRARALSAAPELPHSSLAPSMAARGQR